MTTRKGGITRSQLDRQWPHHVALTTEKVRRLANSETVRGVAASLNAALTYHLTEPERVVFCFSMPEDAQTFAERFGGERLESGGRR
jgi:hypothetical protein